MATTYEGGCLCGAVRYRVTGTARNRCYCHCRSCRLATGAPFVAWATFDRSRFETVAGTLTTVRSSKHVERGFCGKCGTSITYVHDKRPEDLDVTLATITNAEAIAPERHIWVADKLAWVAIGDGLPEHDKWGGDS